MLGLLDLEAMAALEAEGAELTEYPIVPFLTPGQKRSKTAAHKKHKPKRKKRR